MINSGQSSAGYHRLEDLMVCPRRFGYRDVLHLVPVAQPQPLALGTCVHTALAAHYSGEDPYAALKTVGRRNAYCIPLAEPIIRAYLEYYACERIEVLAVEREFEVLVAGQRFTRRIDLVRKLRGKAWIVDHKTSGNFTKRQKSFAYDASLFTQQLVAPAVARDLGLSVGGVVVNLIATGRPFNFSQVPVTWTPKLLADAPLSIGYWSAQAVRLKESGIAAWQWPQTWACQGRYSECDYLDLCLNGTVALASYEEEEAR